MLPSVSIPCSTPTPGESSLTIADTVDNIQKTIGDKFYVNITKYDTKWSEQCIVCGKIQYDSKDVTTNMNRHMKTQHKAQYKRWIDQLNENSQKKILTYKKR